MTLPLIYALSQAKAVERREIEALITAAISADDVAVIRDFVIQKGGIEYARKQAEYWIQDAHMHLDNYPADELKTHFLDFTHYIIRRER